MNGYLVDTNVPSELTRGVPDAHVASFLAKAGKSSVFLSVMTIGEIAKGILALPASHRRAGLEAGSTSTFGSGLRAASCL